MLDKRLLVITLASSIAACGGGGGSSNVIPSSASMVPYQTPVRVSNFQPLVGSGLDAPVMDIFTKDLNKDNVDEVVVAGRKTQLSTVGNWRDFNMQLYGWNNAGNFTNETSTWFSGTDNTITGTEPSVKFGDFDGDTNIDMFVAASTDMDGNPAESSVFTNSGTNSFTRTDLTLGDPWSHDSAVYDFNNDGKSDILATAYVDGELTLSYGTATAGIFDTYIADINRGSSSVSVGDYIEGNGKLEIIMTDAGGYDTRDDTVMYSYTAVAGVLTLTEEARLPGSAFTAEQVAADSTYGAHGIRNIAMDFNNDGHQDVVVFERLRSSSAVQFFENNGAGVFTDVTSSTLVNYDGSEGGVNYQPVIMDINNDGLDDIFLSGVDYDGTYNTTQVLVQTSDGKFVSSYSDTFKTFHNTIEASTANATGWDQAIQVVKGPAGDSYLVSNVVYDDGGTGKSAMYLAKIGSTGTISPQTMTELIQEAWPYITANEAASALTMNSVGSINGIAIADLNAAMNPVDGLGISLDGRNGTRTRLIGNISAPGLDTSMLSQVSAVDGLGREYVVDLSVMSKAVDVEFNTDQMVTRVDRTWGSTLISNTVHTANMSAGADDVGQRFNSFGGSTGSNWHYRVGVGKLNHNPWLAMTGAFGTVISANVTDFTVGYQTTGGTWAQAGITETHTNLTPGVVQAITPLRAVYATAGMNFETGTLYAGIAPVLFDGKIKMKVPTSVDFDGTMHYTNYESELRNNVTGFIGATHAAALTDLSNLNTKATLTTTGSYNVNVDYSLKF